MTRQPQTQSAPSRPSEPDTNLLTTEQELRMLANGEASARRAASGQEPEDFEPVVKLFCPWSASTWLLTELYPEDPDIAFGLCDLGMGFPELGSVSLSELAAIRSHEGLRIERDLTFKPTMTLQGYAEAARREQGIVD
jgi:hypothetical protein